jgi:uncharacterized protein
MRRLVVILIRFYQLTISPLLPHSCRYYPSCSDYAITVYKEYGIIKGTFLSIKRILKCNPFFAGGYDPAPSKEELKH